MRTTLLVSMVALAGASSALGQTFPLGPIPGGGGGLIIPDGGLGGITIGSGPVSGTLATISSVTASITISQTWIGDITAELRYDADSNGSTDFTLTLFERVGRNLTGFGDHGNLDGTYTFQDGGANLWATSSPLADSAVVPPASTRPPRPTPAPSSRSTAPSAARRAPARGRSSSATARRPTAAQSSPRR